MGMTALTNGHLRMADCRGHCRSASTPTAGSLGQQSRIASNGGTRLPNTAEGQANFKSAHELLQSDQLLEISHKRVSKIACIGAGYVGAPTSAVIAFKNPEVDVTTVDLNAQRIAAWNSASLPIYEPGLDEIVFISRDGLKQTQSLGLNGGSTVPSRLNNLLTANDDKDRQVFLSSLGHRGRRPNLFFSTDVRTAVEEADLILISVNTPTKLHGLGRGSAPDLGYFEAAARSIALFATTDKIVVEKSTVPCGTAESIRKILETNGRPGVQFEILSNPEFLAEGTAVSDLLDPDRILIGSLSTPAGYRAAASLAEIYASWVPEDRIITMNLWSSELSKLAANALLAQRISSVNALSAICEKTGANIDEVSYACGLDSRIGPRMLKAGPGFGGSCFKKDILSLVYICESLHLYEVASYWKSVVTINEYQKDRFAKRIIACFYNTLTRKKIAVLGFAYKKDTGDTRESAAIELVRLLAAEKAKVAIYDPAVKEEQIWIEFGNDGELSGAIKENVELCRSAYEACFAAHAVVILTEWEEFSNKTSDLPMARTPALAPKDPNRHGPNSSRTVSIPSKSVNGVCHQSEKTNVADSFVASNGIAHPKTTAAANGNDENQKRLDWRRIAMGMEKPMYVFDSRNLLDPVKLEKLGFRVEAIGRASNHDRQSDHSSVFID
ncbi:MAG: hypothetical protein M1816_003839 [Peltula sp. TS41687]|nr:MAG: hypothetical protein M1816_003839 [Peltula sp. TS41687]